MFWYFYLEFLTVFMSLARQQEAPEYGDSAQLRFHPKDPVIAL